VTIQLVGAGLGRTGTHSLKLALEKLLGGTCHHMMEVTDAQGPTWHGAFTGEPPDWPDAAQVKTAYVAHNDAVRATVPTERLFEYQPGDGWGPLCAALNVPEPDEPFPHTNTTEEFNRRRAT